MRTIEQLIEECDATLVKARELTAYTNSDAFYAPDITEFERRQVKQQETSLLEYHASLISLIQIKQNPA